MQQKVKAQYKTESCYQSFSESNNSWPLAIKGSEESQDQLYYLLLGTALVSKLVDDDATYNGNVFQYENAGVSSLRQEAINISDRLIKHVSNSAGGLWMVRDPENNNSYVGIGQSATAYAYAIDNAGCFIKYGQDLPSYYLGIDPVLANSCTDYRNLTSLTPIAWNGIVSMNGGPTVDMQGFYHALSAVCNCDIEDRSLLNLAIQATIDGLNDQIHVWLNWLRDKIDSLPSWLNWAKKLIAVFTDLVNSIIHVIQYVINELLLDLFSPARMNTTEQRLIYNNSTAPVNYLDCDENAPTQRYNIGSKSYFGIFAWRVLHPNQAALPNWLQLATGNLTPITYPQIRDELRTILENAPCEGNYNFSPFGRPSSDWGAPNRLDRMDPIFYYNDHCPRILGEFHGLDYMLLHNLYYLSEGSNAYFNHSDRKINEQFPSPSGAFSNAFPRTRGAFEYITSENATLNSNAGVDFRAGKIIDLKPGFTTKSGANFHAYISPYKCSGSPYNGEMDRHINGTVVNNEYEGDLYKEASTNKDESINQNHELTYEQQSVVKKFISELDSMIKSTNSAILDNIYTKITVFPNPSNGNFNIAFDLNREDNINLQILDASGKEIYNHKHIVGNITYPIDLTAYADGLYMVIAKNTKGDTYIKKITINHEINNK